MAARSRSAAGSLQDSGGPAAPARPARARVGRDGAVPAGRAVDQAVADRHAAIRRIAAEMSGHSGLASVYEDVLRHAIELFGAERAGLWTVEDGDRPFRLAAQRGLTPTIIAAVDGAARGAVSVRPRGADAAAWRAVAGRATVVIENRPAAPRPGRGTPHDVGPGTDCYVPVMALDEPMALLVLSHPAPHAWTRPDLALVAAFAGQMAVTIQNARLYDRVQAFAASLEAIKDLAGNLNRIHEVAAIGQAIVSQIRDLFASDTARVYTVDHATGMCEPIAFGGVFLGTADPSPEMLRVEIGRGLTGWVAANNAPLRVADARSDPRRLTVGPDEEPDSMLFAPMAYEDVVRGVIVVSRKGFDRYSADDLTTLSIFAGFAAQSLANAENIERLSRQQTELEHRFAGQRALLDVNETLLGSRNPGVVLELIADGLKSVVRYDNLTIYRLDRENGVRIAVLARDRFAEIILAEKIAIGSGLTGWAAERGEAVLANNAHLDPRAVNIPGTPSEAESLIVVPLRVGGDVIGTLNVGRMGEVEAHFTPVEFELVKLFAGQASIALQTTDVIHAAELRAERDALTGLRNHGVFQAALDDLLAPGCRGPGGHILACSCSTSTGSRPTTTVAATRLATGCCGPSQTRCWRGSAMTIAPIATAATSSRCCSPASAGWRRRPSPTAWPPAVEALGGPDDAPRVTVSVGIACFPDDGLTKDDIVMLADAELYLEKAARRKIRLASGGSTAGRGAEYEAAIHEATFTLMARRDPTELLETIVTRAATLAGTPNGYLYLVDPDAERLRLAVGLGALTALVDFAAGARRRSGRPRVGLGDTRAGRRLRRVGPAGPRRRRARAGWAPWSACPSPREAR